MRVYLGVNGMGLGHIVRSEALAKRLASDGVDVLFSTYLDGLEYASRRQLKTVESVPIFYHVRQDGSIDLKTTASRSGFSLGANRFIRQLNREIRNIGRYAPDLVISDSRLSSVLAAKLMRRPVILVVNQFRIRLLHDTTYPAKGPFDKLFMLIARLGWTFIGTLISEIWTLSDRIIIPDFPPPLTISKYNLSIPRRHASKVRFVGPVADEDLSNDNRKRAAAERETITALGLERDKILIYAAISGPRYEREPLIEKLKPILGALSETWNVVMSCGNPLGVNSPKRLKKMLVYEWLKSQDEFFRVCDIIIARAGQGTILKAIRIGRPLILIPTPFQTEQLGNADRASSIGTAVVLEQEKLSVWALQAAIEKIVTTPTYFRTADQIAKQVRRFNGIAQCIDLIHQFV